MTLAQRAALLDQLKLPIEEAPRDGTPILGIFRNGRIQQVEWTICSRMLPGLPEWSRGSADTWYESELGSFDHCILPLAKPKDLWR